MRYTKIVATGRNLPGRRVTNDELRPRFSNPPDLVEKLEMASGIRARYWAADDQCTSDIAVPACQQALKRAGLAAEDLDLILLGTDSPDFITPATSTVLQHKLGARRAGTFDIGCACASFPTAVAAAAGLIATSPGIDNVLVVGAYEMHKLASPEDPTIFFYGDGAGAAVLRASERPGFLGSSFLADGSYAKYWGIFSGGTYEPASVESVRAGRTTVQRLQRYPPEVNHEGWPRLVRMLAERCAFAVDDIDFLLFTQVSKPSIELVMNELKLPMARTHTVMEEWGYTGSACLPIALDSALQQERIHRGDLVVIVGSGVGYNQAAVALQW